MITRKKLQKKLDDWELSSNLRQIRHFVLVTEYIEIAVDPSISSMGELDYIRSCHVKVSKIPEPIVSQKMNEYLQSIVQIKVESDCDQGTSKSTINIDNSDDFKSFVMKLEQEELIIKDEVVKENSSLDIIKCNKSFPTPGIRDQLLNIQVEVVSSICRIRDLHDIQACHMSYKSIFEMKVDHTTRETSIAEDALKSKVNVDNFDFDALEMKLEQEEPIIKDEPDEVAEETSKFEVIKYQINPSTYEAVVASSTLKKHVPSHKAQKIFNPRVVAPY